MYYQHKTHSSLHSLWILLVENIFKVVILYSSHFINCTKLCNAPGSLSPPSSKVSLKVQSISCHRSELLTWYYNCHTKNHEKQIRTSRRKGYLVKTRKVPREHQQIAIYYLKLKPPLPPCSHLLWMTFWLILNHTIQLLGEDEDYNVQSLRWMEMAELSVILAPFCLWKWDV